MRLEPNPISIENTNAILAVLKELDFEHTRIDWSAEGGQGVVWRNGSKYAHIECLNTGEMIGITFDEKNGITCVKDVTPDDLNETLAWIRSFME